MTRKTIAVVLLGAACNHDTIPRLGDGLDMAGQPAQLQQDYAVFANRCSKCHSLERPLNLAARNTSDEFWERYVERMRRQTGSGISPEDGLVIRRFLHVYSRLEKSRRNDLRTQDSPDNAPSPSPALDGGP